MPSRFRQLVVSSYRTGQQRRIISPEKFVENVVKIGAETTADFVKRTRNLICRGLIDRYSTELFFVYIQILATSAIAALYSLSSWRAPKFSRIWDLLGFLFFKKTRDCIWTPVIEEMKADYAAARRKYRTKVSQLWLRTCFALQTVVLILQTWKVAALGIIWAFIPESMKAWIEHFFRTP